MQDYLRILVGLGAAGCAMLVPALGDASERFRQFPPGGTGVPAVPGTGLSSLFIALVIVGPCQ